MTSVPYPSFVNKPPVDALSAVGKCRIYPETCTSNTEEYRAIVDKCVQQALVTITTDNKSELETNKKLQKKFMKESVAMAKTYLMESLGLDVSIVDVEVVVSGKDLVESDGCLASCLLDAGCHAIVTDGKHLEAMDAAKIPRERLVAHFEEEDSTMKQPAMLEALFTAASPWASVASFGLSRRHVPHDAETTMDMLNLASDQMQVVVVFHSEACQDVSNETLAACIGKISKGQEGKDGGGVVSIMDPTAKQLGLAYAACMKTDRDDGLFTTVVCTRSGEALGLVYSSKESIVAALECGRGVYYSRSRKGLWKKGDTSGHYQTLHRIDVDCDGDALRFTVTQRGDDDDVAAFCHLNTLTCWGEPRGLRHLEGTLQERLKSAPEGSYTKRLFDDEALLRDKLVEEAQELSEASSPQHVAEELADVLYFAMVRAAKAGVSIDDAVAELDRRSRKVTRRKGDSKAFRIAAGNEILNKKPE